MPLFEGGASAPVEFAPPEDLRPGQIGTLLDERANTLDVTATIVDLAVRGYLLIQEIPKEGLVRQARLDPDPPREGRRRPAAVRAEAPRRTVPRRQRGHAVIGLRNDLRRAAAGRGGLALRRRRPQGWFRRVPTRSARAGPARVAAAGGGGRPHVRARAVDPLGARRDPRDRGRAAARLVRSVHAGADGEGHGDAPADPWVPDRDRDRRDPHVPVGRGGERLHPLPAVRDRLRLHREVGEGVRGARARAGHLLVRLAPAVRLRGLRGLDRRVRGHRPAGRSPRRRRRPDRAGSGAAGSPGAAEAAVAAARGDPGRAVACPRAAP